MDAVQVEGGKPTNGEQNEAASSEEAQDRWNLIPINSPMSWPEKDVDSWGFVRKQFSLAALTSRVLQPDRLGIDFG